MFSVINIVCWVHVNTIVYYSQDIGSELAVMDNVNGGDIFILFTPHNNLNSGTSHGLVISDLLKVCKQD